MKDVQSLPADYELEKALLSAMIQDNQIIDKFSDEDAGLFYAPSNRHVFTALLSMRREGVPTDFKLVLNRLRTAGLEDESGGPEYLNSIWESAPTPSAWEYYAEALIEKQDLRHAISMGNRVCELAYAHKPDLAEIERIANSYRRTVKQQADIGTVASAVIDLAHYLEKVQYGTIDDNGVDWGFSEMESVIDKLRPGDLCLVGGFPGSGKTSILNSVIAHSCVPHKKPSLVFSLEMPVRDELMRLVSIAGRIPIRRMRTKGGMSNSDMSAFQKWSQVIFDSKVGITDSIVSIHEIYDQAKAYKDAHGLELVGIDHAQLLRMSGTGERARYQGLDEAGRVAKWMAKELNCAVMLLTQISRIDESPFECSALEAHSDQYIIIPKTEQKNAFVRKQRNGPVGHVELNFYAECAAFY